MMGKLFKYDMKNIWKSIFPFILGMLGITVIACLFCRYANSYASSGNNIFLLKIIYIISIVYIVLFVFSFIAFSILSLVFVMKRYFDNFFTDEGYLTFTLPVKPSSLLASKILSGSLFMLISIVFMAVCAVLFVMFGLSTKGIVDKEILDTIICVIKSPFTGKYLLLAVEITLFALVGLVFSITFFQLCITIGSIIAVKHKIIAAIAIFYGSSFILSIIEQIILTSLLLDNSIYWYSSSDVMPVVHSTIITMALVIVAAAIAVFLINNRLLTKKINLN